MSEAPQKPVRIIDLSALIYPIWHTRQQDYERDPDCISNDCVGQVILLTGGHPAAIAVDSAPTYRLEIAPDYKAGRDEKPMGFIQQIERAVQMLREDHGYPVWRIAGYEADDIIASAVQRLSTDDEAVQRGLHILTQDKDLLQLVKDGTGVAVLKPALAGRHETLWTEETVREKFGVGPEKLEDWLCLVGDKADNIQGCKGFGAKRATELLRNQTLDEVMGMLNSVALDVTPAQRSELKALRPRLDVVRTLVQLVADLDIPVDQIWEDREANRHQTGGVDGAQAEEEPAATCVRTNDLAPDSEGTINAEIVEEVGKQDGVPAPDSPAATETNGSSEPTGEAAQSAPRPAPPAAVAELVDESLELTGPWERQLEVRNIAQARQLARWLHDSRLFSAYGRPEAVLSTILLGRELGLQTMAALRAVHIVDGRHTLSADIMVALVLKSGLAEYFEMVSSSDDEATWATKRKGSRREQTLTYTFEQAQRTGKVDPDKPRSAWMAFRPQMLRKQAKAELARLVYPDLLAGLYTPEELGG